MEFQGTELGAELLFILLGVIAAMAIAVVGQAYWAWRRSRGQLRSADKTVPNLASSERRDNAR